MDVFEDTNRVIYSKASPWINAIGYQWMSRIDIEQVNLDLIETTEHGYNYCPFQKRPMIDFNKEAYGRGGEQEF